MYKKACYTCKVVVLRNKPIAFLTSSLPSPSSLLKLPNIYLSIKGGKTPYFNPEVSSKARHES